MGNTLEIRHGFANIADVVIAYEDLGDVNGDPMVLIMGLGSQLVMWPIGFCEKLVKKVIGSFVSTTVILASHRGPKLIRRVQAR
jgi:hypothetical protein